MFKKFKSSYFETSLFVFLSFFALSSFGGQVSFEVKAQSLCLDCSIHFQQIFQSSVAPVLRKDTGTTANQKNMVIAVINQPAIHSLESYAVNRVANQLYQTAIGRGLIETAIQQGNISYRLFYQLGLDQSLQPYLYNEDNIPSYKLENADPHELWGFSKSDGKTGIVVLNQHQTLTSASYTMIHELSHLLDVETSNYLERYPNYSTTELDQFALEFRAVYAEVLFHQQNQNSNQIQDKKSQAFYNKFLDRSGNINLKNISNYVLDTLFPTKASKTLAVDPNYATSINHFAIRRGAGIQESKKAMPAEAIEQGILSAASWFFNEGLLNCLSSNCSDLSVTLLNYKNSEPNEANRWGVESRQRLFQTLFERTGSRSEDLTVYLKNNGLLNTTSAAFETRKDGLNSFGSVIPSPRVNGGGRFKKMQPEPTSQFENLIQNQKTNLKKQDSTQRFEVDSNNKSAFGDTDNNTKKPIFEKIEFEVKREK